MIQILILALAVLTEPIQTFNIADIPEERYITLPYIDIEQDFLDCPGIKQKLDSAYHYINSLHSPEEYFIRLSIWENGTINYFVRPGTSLYDSGFEIAAKRNAVYLGYMEYRNIPVVISQGRDIPRLKISVNRLKSRKFWHMSLPIINDSPTWVYRAPIKKNINDEYLRGMMLYEMSKYAQRRMQRIETYIANLKISLEAKKKYRYMDIPYWSVQRFSF